MSILTFAVKGDSSGSKSSGHDSGSRTWGAQKERPFCTKCQINGHTLDTCYRIHGYPPGYKPKHKPKFEHMATHSPAATATINHAVNNDSPTVPQDGNFFQSLNPKQYQQLMMMFATHLSNSVAANSSTVIGSSFSTDSWLMDHFYHDQFIIQEISTKKMIGKSDKVGDLYFFYPISSTSHITTAVNKVSASIWHNRLGHSSLKSLEVLKTLLPCDDLHSLHLSLCYVCPKAKQRRLPFIPHNDMSKSPFDFMHCDIWCPYCVHAHTGDRFFCDSCWWLG